MEIVNSSPHIVTQGAVFSVLPGQYNFWSDAHHGWHACLQQLRPAIRLHMMGPSMGCTHSKYRLLLQVQPGFVHCNW
eukprot:SAG31_NODE_45_length_31062_cov_17.179957_21_plen_77_part_00